MSLRRIYHNRRSYGITGWTIESSNGFTLIEVALVLFILMSLLVVFYANSNKSSDLRLARVSMFEAKKIAQLAEECRNKIESTGEISGIYEDTYSITNDDSTHIIGTVSDMLDSNTGCGFQVDIPNKTPFDYGQDYKVVITNTEAKVEFFVPIINYRNEEIDITNIKDEAEGVTITLYGGIRANSTSKFSNRALLDKSAFFGEKINRDG